MSDVGSQLSQEEMAELAALADGTLPADRRAELEARVAVSPELQELLERQRRAVAALAGLETDEPPASLLAGIEERIGRPRLRRRAPRLALAGGLAVVAAVIGAIVLSSGPGAPTVAEAAQLAAEAPTAPAPAVVGAGAARLAVDVDGVQFPSFARAYGWKTLGVRRGRVEGRDAVVVYYGKGSRRLAYVIVSGRGLRPPAAQSESLLDGVRYETLRLDEHLAVTWRRGGHTCVLVGDAERPELLRLASWPLRSAP